MMNRCWILAARRFIRSQKQCRGVYSRSSYLACSSVAAHVHPRLQIVNIERDFVNLEKLWLKETNQTKLKQFLFEKFSSQNNSYSYTLSLISQSLQHNEAQDNLDLAFEILMSFGKWLERNSSAINTLSLELKQKALEIAMMAKDKCVMQLLCDLFKLSQDKTSLKVLADKLIAEKNYHDASYCAIILGIQEDIPLEEILLPLLFRSKCYGLAMKYVNGFPEIQLKLAKTLDEIIGDAKSSSVLKYDNMGVDVKQLCKFLSKLLKMHHINPELCPNLQRAKGYGTLNFLIRRKLQQVEPDATLNEKILDYCKEQEHQRALLCKLVSINDFKSAYMFAKALDVPRSEWPQDLIDKEDCFDLGSLPSLPVGGEESKKSNIPVDFLTLQLPKSSVKLVSTENELLDCLEEIETNHKVVGLDSEWKPQRSKSDRTRLSLIQLAVQDKVYILDLISLNPSYTHPHHWSMLMKSLFSNPEIIKLGCGVMQDVQMLIDEITRNTDQSITFSHIVDVSFLYEKMASLYEEEISDEDSVHSGMKGLSKLCEIILGKPLNKEARFCNWEERPLADSRVQYAALDANCLVQMFEKFKSRAEECNVNFEHQLNKAMVMTTSMTRVLRVKRGWKMTSGHSSFSFTPPLIIGDLKFVVDSSLKDLGMQLRMFGADVKIITSFDGISDEESLQFADEDRVLISIEENQEKAQKIFPENRMYLVQDSDLDSKTLAQIFKHFNIKFAKEAIYSRCMECNNSKFLKISAEDLENLWNKSIESEPKDSLEKDKLFYGDVCIDGNGVMSNGVRIQLEKLKPNIFTNCHSDFKICRTCGDIAIQS